MLSVRLGLCLLCVLQLVLCDNVDSSEECEEGYYLQQDGCERCSQCGPNLYEKSECSPTRDTVCDWCLSKEPVLNEDFYKQCNNYKQLYDSLRADLKPDLHNHLNRSFRHSLGVNWGLASLLMVCVGAMAYMATKMWHRRTFRVVSLVPPQLTEEEQQNIVFAADHIRNKRLRKYQPLDYV